MADSNGSRRWIKADLGPQDIAHYIADTVRDLVPLSKLPELRDLNYLLMQTLAEAEDRAQPQAGSERTGQ